MNNAGCAYARLSLPFVTDDTERQTLADILSIVERAESHGSVRDALDRANAIYDAHAHDAGDVHGGSRSAAHATACAVVAALREPAEAALAVNAVVSSVVSAAYFDALTAATPVGRTAATTAGTREAAMAAADRMRTKIANLSVE